MLDTVYPLFLSCTQLSFSMLLKVHGQHAEIISVFHLSLWPVFLRFECKLSMGKWMDGAECLFWLFNS